MHLYHQRYLLLGRIVPPSSLRIIIRISPFPPPSYVFRRRNAGIVVVVVLILMVTLPIKIHHLHHHHHHPFLLLLMNAYRGIITHKLYFPSEIIVSNSKNFRSVRCMRHHHHLDISDDQSSLVVIMYTLHSSYRTYPGVCTDTYFDLYSLCFGSFVFPHSLLSLYRDKSSGCDGYSFH